MSDQRDENIFLCVVLVYCVHINSVTVTDKYFSKNPKASCKHWTFSLFFVWLQAKREQGKSQGKSCATKAPLFTELWKTSWYKEATSQKVKTLKFYKRDKLQNLVQAKISVFVNIYRNNTKESFYRITKLPFSNYFYVVCIT